MRVALDAGVHEKIRLKAIAAGMSFGGYLLELAKLDITTHQTPEIQYRDLQDGRGEFTFTGKARERLQGVMDKTGKSADEAFDLVMAKFFRGE